MSKLDDLNASEASMEEVVAAAIDFIKEQAAELSTANSADDSDAIEDVVSKMNATADKLRAALPAPATSGDSTDTTSAGSGADTIPSGQAST